MNWLEALWLRITGRGHVVIWWREYHARQMRIRRLAAQLWLADGGHMPYRNGGVIHTFMVQHPDTQKEFERLAETQIDREVV